MNGKILFIKLLCVLFPVNVPSFYLGHSQEKNHSDGDGEAKEKICTDRLCF